MKLKKIFLLPAALLLMLAMTVTSYADPGESGGNGVAGAPGVMSPVNNPGVPDLDAIVAGAGLDALGDCNISDPILGVTPMAYYTMKNHQGIPLVDGVPSTTTQYLYCKDGFSVFYMDHAGVGRYYYRVYSANEGWSTWCNSKENTPGRTDGSKIQAIQIRVKGYAHTLGDIYYKAVLNDGTVLDWAKNGQTLGTMGTDKYIVALAVSIWDKNQAFPASTARIMASNAYDGAFKAADGRILYSTFDGNPYTGWGWVDNTQYYFVNSVPVSGWQYIDGYKYYLNEDGSVCKDLEPVMGQPGAYQINYNKATRTLYIMAQDGENGFIIPYKTFMSSCGPDTPLGDYKTYASYDWKFMHDDIYCQKLTRFYQGFLMHSLLYYDQPNPFTLDAINYNYIDDAASGGCIRLRAGDANWIYSCVPLGTTIHIYEDVRDKGPVEKDAIDQVIPREQVYDPTDPAALAALAAGVTNAAEYAAYVAGPITAVDMPAPIQ